MEDNLLDEEDKSSVTYLLSEILKKSDLEEKPDKAFEKIEKNVPTNGEIVSKICSDLAKNLISESDAILSLEKNLGVSEEKAKQIINDIKNIILPPLKQIFEKRLKTTYKKSLDEPSTTSNEKPISPFIKKSDALNLEEEIKKDILQEERPFITQKSAIEKSEKKFKKPIKKTEEKEMADKFIKKPKSSGSDKYRESL